MIDASTKFPTDFSRNAKGEIPNSGVIPRKTHSFPKDPDGWYIEPRWCSARLFKVERFPTRLILDPCCGWGRITTAAQRAGYRVRGSDIVDRGRHGLERRFRKLDFLRSDLGLQPGTFSIVMNPRFDRVEDFCRRALGVGAAKVAALMTLHRFPAAHWLQQLPLVRVWLVSPRPSMPPGKYLETGRRAKGGRFEFSWLIFEPGASGPATIHWLHREAHRDD